ncbi:hypothetical protein JCM6882_002324 [Rhodosporidiobolus microsporus]
MSWMGKGAPPSTPPHPSPPPDTPTSLPWPDLEEEEVCAALFAARPFTAAGPDEVSNHILRLCWPLLCHRLVPLLAASLHLGHVPPRWKEGTVTVLKKPKKPDYALPKANRLIVFGQLTAKLLKTVVARRIAHLGEGNKEILPKAHYGGRRCRSAEDAAVAINDEVKRQWQAGRVVVAMAVNLAKAFPSVLEEKVAEALREAGFGEEMVGWVRERMRERSVRVWFEGVMSGKIDWRSGLPQGGGARDGELASQRGASFKPEKTMLTLFAPPNKILPHPLPTVVLNGEPLPYSPTLTMLGVEFNSSLSYRAHRAVCTAMLLSALQRDGSEALD